MITKQQYLDMLIEAAYDGTFPSIDPTTTKCLYRGPNGTKCAIGLLIPDEKYGPQMEDTGSIFGMVNNIINAIGDGAVSGMVYSDYINVQQQHDLQARESREWDGSSFVRRLANCNVFFGCTFPST